MNKQNRRKSPKHLRPLPQLKLDDTVELRNQIPLSFSPINITKGPSKISNNFNIFLGSEYDAMDSSTLKKHNITHVLTIMHKKLPSSITENLTAYKHIAVLDCPSTDLYCHFSEAFEFLNSNSKPGCNTLVHCHQGISRSSTICLAYMMKKTEQTMEACYEKLREKRNVISPNFGFLGQLKRFESVLKQEMSPRSPVAKKCKFDENTRMNNMISVKN